MNNLVNVQLLCPHCGSDDIGRDATASWVPALGEWGLVGTHDDMTCDTCGDSFTEAFELPIGSAAVFAVTQQSFDGATDETDGLISWVSAFNRSHVVAMYATGTIVELLEDIPTDHADVDFKLDVKGDEA